MSPDEPAQGDFSTHQLALLLLSSVGSFSEREAPLMIPQLEVKLTLSTCLPAILYREMVSPELVKPMEP